MPLYLNGEKEIQLDEDGTYEANCSVCFYDKRCLPITYPRILEICKEFKASPMSFAVCKECMNMKDKHALHINIMDYFVINQLSNWLMHKEGIVRNDSEFQALLEVAKEQGIIYREDKRMRHRFNRRDRQYQTGFIDMLKGQKTTNYEPNALYQNLFKNLYNDN